MLNNKNFRLLLSSKNSAKFNMAYDESLVLNFQKDDLPILRFYSWEKSFTLGVSQSIKDYQEFLNYSNDYAKRITGGGILLHEYDVSYSLIIPSSYMKNLSVKSSYEKICSFLLDFYDNLGLKSSYAKDNKNIHLSKSPFCQNGFESYDILINSKKIGGNAQKRTKNLIFQHGSIPIKNINSNLTIGYSLEDFNITLSNEKAIKLLIQSFKNIFKIDFIESKLNEKEEKSLSFLLKDKYDTSN
jgi:lipoyl(octanoyl) transferase